MVRTYDLNGNKQIYRVESHALERNSMAIGGNEDGYICIYAARATNIPVMKSARRKDGKICKY
jgi:hypothetical protein